MALVEGGGGNQIVGTPFVVSLRPGTVTLVKPKPKAKIPVSLTHKVIAKKPVVKKPIVKKKPTVTPHPPVAGHTAAPKPAAKVGSSKTTAGGSTIPKPVATATGLSFGLSQSTEVILVGVGLFVLALLILKGRKRR